MAVFRLTVVYGRHTISKVFCFSTKMFWTVLFLAHTSNTKPVSRNIIQSKWSYWLENWVFVTSFERGLLCVRVPFEHVFFKRKNRFMKWEIEKERQKMSSRSCLQTEKLQSPFAFTTITIHWEERMTLVALSPFCYPSILIDTRLQTFHWEE